MSAMEDASARRKRKDEARKLKRKRIEDAGGVRPRASKESRHAPSEQHSTTASRRHETRNNGTSVPTKRTAGASNHRSQQQRHISKKSSFQQKHRFGRVMESVPCRNEARHWTLSIAVPGSVVSNCQTRELRTQLVGQIARAAAVYQVDEIVVFDDKLADRRGRANGGFYGRDVGHTQRKNPHGAAREQQTENQDKAHEEQRVRSDPHTFMARVLQYCECPQYLRRHFFPMHPDLQFSGLLAPIDAPHHVRVEERSKYREGVVLEGKGTGPNAGSLVNCGIRGRPVEIDRVLTPGIRCTVELNPKAYGCTGRIRGKVVSPSAPRQDNGTYWGYTTRLATSINAVFEDSPFEGGYDLKIGTSERGDVSMDDKMFSLPTFEHCLVVFGGVAGIEECVDADEQLKIPGSESRKLFDMWVNICPYQGSRTIRTEEAVLIALARVSPFVSRNSNKQTVMKKSSEEEIADIDPVEFSDESPSDESSTSSGDSE